MRTPSEWKVEIVQLFGRLGRDSSLPIRSCISFAALLVKVMAAMLRGWKPQSCDQIGDLLRDHPRLARAGAGQHQQGAVEVVDRFALLGIEAGHGSESTRDTATGKAGDIKEAPRRSGAR